MATPLTHALVPLVVGNAFIRRPMPARFWAALALCAAAADLDTLGFGLGIPYASPLGHRGLLHSLTFAVGLGLVAGAVILTSVPPQRRGWGMWLLFLLACIQHPLLDAMTNGGLGVALFWPFDQGRYFLPFRPLEVSPIGLRHVLSQRTLEVLASEFVWVWLPLGGLYLALAALRATVTKEEQG
jgi:inner membrane protein